MTTHPQISHVEREERIRAIAYQLWLDEGCPHGCADSHWFKAEQLIDAEATVPDPAWLVREEPAGLDPAAVATGEVPDLDEVKPEEASPLRQILAGLKVA